MSTIAISQATPSRRALRVTLWGVQALPAGALGLMLPSLTHVQPRLTELAALPVTAVLGLLAACVAWGRGTAAPVAPRGR